MRRRGHARQGGRGDERELDAVRVVHEDAGWHRDLLLQLLEWELRRAVHDVVVRDFVHVAHEDLLRRSRLWLLLLNLDETKLDGLTDDGGDVR